MKKTLNTIVLLLLVIGMSGCLKGSWRTKSRGCGTGKAKDVNGDCGAIDRTAPTASLSASFGAATGTNPFIITATFSEVVYEFAAAGVTVSNGRVASISGEGTTYSISITPEKEGAITIALLQEAAKDFAGNASTASSQLSITYDATPPTLSLVSVDRPSVDLSTNPDPTLTVLVNEAAKVTLYNDSTCSVSLSAAAELQANSGQGIKVSGLFHASNTSIHGKAVDASGNSTACTTLKKYTHIVRFRDPNPSASNGFGATVVKLSGSGNVVVTSPQADINGVNDSGAVYLFNGETGALISTLYGSTASDQVGVTGVTALSSGRFIVRSINWDCQTTLGCLGAAANVGAVTFVDGTIGINGPVTTSNSLVGSTASDQVGNSSVTLLKNGNYVVVSTLWDCQATLGCSGTIADTGAVTFGNGTTGVTGVVSTSNSLVGSSTGDLTSATVTALTYANYVVSSPQWDCVASAGCGGTVNDVGAATLGNGTTGTFGQINTSNSLYGTTASDQVSSGGVTALTNGNYVVLSPLWNCLTTLSCTANVADVGAATFSNGTTGITGAATAANSLVGSSVGDGVGSGYTAPLTNGNYVVSSTGWDCLTTLSCTANVVDVGAATFGNGTTGITGVVSATNSLVGSTTGDATIQNIKPLTNGNYVVNKAHWDCAVAAGCAGSVLNVGAITFGNGTTGTSGVTGPSNSLVGTTASDAIGNLDVTVLTNGNYVVSSSQWDCLIALGCTSNVTEVGAATFGNGTTGSFGAVNASNSLVGSTSNDGVGWGIVALTNGNYVARSPNWDCQSALGCSGTVADVGAVTFCNGSTGCNGIVTASNSLIGSTASDQIGSAGIVALKNGNYVVRSSLWDCQPSLGCSGTAADVGAITLGDGSNVKTGEVSASNSLVGSTASDQIGTGGGAVLSLSNNTYVVRAPTWDCQASLGCSASLADAGAVIIGDATTGVTGAVSASNSLVGSTAGDQLGTIFLPLISAGYFFSGSNTWGVSDEKFIIMVNSLNIPAGIIPP